MVRRLTLADLDRCFPTLVRYTGWALTIGLVAAAVLGIPASQLAAGFVAAAGMILYKAVANAAKERDDA